MVIFVREEDAQVCHIECLLVYPSWCLFSRIPLRQLAEHDKLIPLFLFRLQPQNRFEVWPDLSGYPA